VLRFFGYFLLLAFVAGSARALERGDPKTVVTFFLVVALWKWRPIFEFVQERRWEDWRNWYRW